MTHEPDFPLVERIRSAVDSRIIRTPLLRSDWLSSLTGTEVFLKCENLQITGSFKIRGGFAALEIEQTDSVVAATAGNHGQGLARAAATAGIKCTIVVPLNVPGVKERSIRSYGARVVRSPFEGYDETEAWMLEHREEFGSTVISPFDHPGVIAGNGGTTALEIFEDMKDVDAVVIPCGGGGCAIGAGIVAEVKSPDTKITAVNTDASAGMWLSRRDRRVYTKVKGKPTIAEGIEGGISVVSYDLGNKYIDDVVVVKEKTIRSAVASIALNENMIVEGAGSAGVAALMEGLVEGERICVILTGSNIDRELLARLLMEFRP